jgi:lauroyl/myristoyl acyltransferase
MGPLRALGGLVERLPGPVCVLLGAGQVAPRRTRLVRTVGGEQKRVAAAVEALHTLRDGGYVLVVVDGIGTALVQQQILGQPVSLAAGAFALARLAHAPMLPVAVRWRGAAVEIISGAVIAPAEESVMASSLVAWLEDYLRAHPGEFSFTLSRLLGVSPS